MVDAEDVRIATRYRMVPGGTGSVPIMAPVEESREAAGTSATSPAGAADRQGHVTALERRMNRRHLMMISFGGVIGTGLFLSTGYTITQAGPLGTVLA